MHIALRGYALILVTFLTAVYAQWSRHDIDMLWRAMAAMVILLLAVEFYTVRYLRINTRRRHDAHALLGRHTHGTLDIHNNSALPVAMQLEQPLPHDSLGESAQARLSIPRSDTRHISINWIPQRLGEYQWNPAYARIRGLFGLAWWSRRFNPAGNFTVLPDYLHAHEKQAGLDQTGNFQHSKSGGGSELLQLRDYQPGDAMRSVDWKATARTGKPIVRLFSEEQHLDIVIVIDAGRTSAVQAGRLTRLHHYVNVASRLAQVAVNNNDQIGFALYADVPLHSMPPARGTAALVKMRRVLRNSSSQGRESNPLAAVMDIKRWLKHRSLVVMFTDLDSSESAGQIIKATGLLSPKHLPMIASIKDEATLSLAQKRASNRLDAYYSLAAMELIDASNSAALRLQRMGAYVVHTIADQLDGSVLKLYRELKQRRKI